MDSNQELQLCQALETGLSAHYRQMPEMTDALCLIGLDNSIIALKQKFGFARNETVISRPAIAPIVANVVQLGVDNIGQGAGVALKDYISVINKIKRSVVRHTAFGPRAYYDFIKNFV